MNKLMEQRASALKACADIKSKAKAEGREVSDTEFAEIKNHMATVDECNTKIKVMVEKDELLNRVDDETKKSAESAGRKTAPNSTAITAGLRERVLDDPNKGFKHPREFILNVMRAGQNGGNTNDDRLKLLKSKETSPEFGAAIGSDEAGTFSNPDGGFLLPVGFSPDVLKLEPEADPIGGRTTKMPMDKPTVEIPSRVDKDHSTSVSGGVVVSRRAEAAAAAASKLKFEQVVMKATSLFGLSYVTEELLSDAPGSFAALLAASFGTEFTSKAIQERLSGTGVGEPLGILNAPCTVQQAAEGGQAADTIKFENVIKMRSRCWGYQDAIWLANHDTIPQLMTMAFVATAIGPIWQPSAREDHPDLLLGRPIIFTEYCEKLGDVGDLVLANWTQYLEGIYQPLQSAESIHVRFVNHERAFKFWLRNAGQPWWKTALTPKKSAVTLSPFVTLAAR